MRKIKCILKCEGFVDVGDDVEDYDIDEVVNWWLIEKQLTGAILEYLDWEEVEEEN